MKGSNGLNHFQTGLDIVGLIPGFGEIADGVNGLIYSARGDASNAALSLGAMIPFVGWASPLPIRYDKCPYIQYAIRKTEIPTSIKSGDVDVKTEIKNLNFMAKGTVKAAKGARVADDVSKVFN